MVLRIHRALIAAAGVGLASACATTSAVTPGPSPFPLARPVTIEPAAAPERGPALSREIPRPTTSLGVAVVRSALSLRGRAYRFGGTSPDSGFDCSGLVSYVLSLHAIDIPRSVADQYTAGRAVGRDQLRAGDLVFFSTTGPGPTHVGIVTNVESAEFVHAPADGSVVRIDRLDATYWRTRWVGARRVLRN